VGIEEDLLTPVIGYVLLLTDCDEMLGVSFLVAVSFTLLRPSSALTKALFPFLKFTDTVDTSSLSFRLVAKSADSG
jgi:hypothetical protein